MIVAIMQPYFFPYIGYFQLMKAVDRFVFYDDAQYMKGGWLNRNRILAKGAPCWWTLPVVRDDFRLPINQRFYAKDADSVGSMMNKLREAYRHAPYYAKVSAEVELFLEYSESRVSTYNQWHLDRLARSLGIECEFYLSSQLGIDGALRGQERVLAICDHLGATGYVNSFGGQKLYNPDAFAARGVTLRFIQSLPKAYDQFDNSFVPYLSIVDVLMFNRRTKVSSLFEEYRLFSPMRVCQ
nr:WbqC family protein [Dyella sp. ASV24]